MRKCWSLLWVVTCYQPGCKVANVPAVVAAPVFAGTAIAATGARRAASGGCWATCSKGWHCDEKSGVCKRDEERQGPALQRTEAIKQHETHRECRAPLRCAGEDEVEGKPRVGESASDVVPGETSSEQTRQLRSDQIAAEKGKLPDAQAPDDASAAE